MSRLKQIKTTFASFFKGLKLKQKFVMLYLIGIVIPVIVVDSVVLFHINAYQDREAKQDMENSVVQTLNEFSSVFEQITYLSKNIVNDTSLIEFLNRNYTSEKDYQKAYVEIEGKSALNYYKFIKEVSNIKIYVENDTIVESDNIKRLDDATRRMWWYQKYSESGANSSLFEDITRNAGSAINPHAGVITLGRRFIALNGREALLLMELNYNQVNHTILREQNKTCIYICNNNRVIFASDSKIFKKDERELPSEKQIKGERLSLQEEFQQSEKNGTYMQ